MQLGIHDPLNRAVANTQLPGDPAHAVSLTAQFEHLGLYFLTHARPAKFFAFFLRPFQTCSHTLHDHAPFKLREHTNHLKHHLACWGRAVDALLVELEAAVFRVNLF